jgi:ATP-binding cassette, subfamily B, bacterial
MPNATPSSKKQYREYIEHVQDREKEKRNNKPDPAPGSKAKSAPDLPLGDTQSSKRRRGFWQLFRSYLKQTATHHRMLIAALISSTIATLLGLIPLYGTKLIFDNVLGDKPLPRNWPQWISLPTEKGALLWVVCGTMTGFALVSLLLHMWSRWHATRISKRVQMDVRRRLFLHAIRLPLHRVYEIKSGGVSSTLREDGGAVGDLVFAMLYNPWRAIIQLGGSLVILALTDWRLLLGSIILLPIVYISVRLWVRRIRPMFRDIRATRAHIDSHATEAFGGIRVVRGFGRQRTETQRFVGNNHYMARQELHVWWWNRAIDIAFSIVIPTASAALLLYGGLQIMADNQAVKQGTLAPVDAFSTGDLVMFLAYLGWLLNPLALLASSATGFQNGLAGLDRVLDLLDEPAELTQRKDAARLEPSQVKGHITLKDVSFAYPRTDKKVLAGINLDIAPGEMIAFVGPSGAGKTTLSNLIARFYEPTEGAVLLDGVDLRDTQVESYRNLLGIVEQDIFLFDGTVAQNIAYGDRNASPDEIINAAKLANAHTFISDFEDGYATLIGERGVKLSGGQRQRIAIARAILANPRILILDEATSNLDTESEQLIQNSMMHLMKDRTSFVIAHRLSTISHADRIVVIDHGRIVEQGKHEELLTRLGPYREMVDLQTRRIDNEEDKEKPAKPKPPHHHH